MRIRLHKSRTTTAIMAASILIVGGVAAGASTSITNLLDRENSPKIESIQDSSLDKGKSGQNHGNNCSGRGQVDNKPDNYNENKKGNGQVSDCDDTTPDPEECPDGQIGSYPDCITPEEPKVCPPGQVKNGDVCLTITPGTDPTPREPNLNRATPTPTSTPLPVSRVLTPRLTNLTTTYNGRSQGVNVSVEPTSANCKVTYNGSSARPTLAGTYDVAVVCRDGKVQGGTTGTFTINKAPTTLNWNDPEPITTLDELSKVQLNAKANVPGTYSYEEKPGLKLPVGTHELNVSFTPRDERNYLPSSTAVDIDVLKYANKFAPIKVPFNLSSAGLTAKTRPVVSELFLSEDVKQITVYGYVQPSNNKKADMKLSLARANTVAKQIRAISPDVKIVVKAMGATINSACNAYKNKCVIVK